LRDRQVTVADQKPIAEPVSATQQSNGRTKWLIKRGWRRRFLRQIGTRAGSKQVLLPTIKFSLRFYQILGIMNHSHLGEKLFIFEQVHLVSWQRFLRRCHSGKMPVFNSW
jgi:hypothetical protein